MTSTRLARLFAIRPTFEARAVVSVLAAVYGVAIVLMEYRAGRPHSDFGMIWFGARALLAGLDPYELIGPGRIFNYEWTLIYPLPALLVGIPFAPLGEQAATAAFIAISTALLTFGLTRNGWHLLPILISEPFVAAARLGQWSIMITAAVFFPWLAIISIAKPQAALPVLAGTKSRSALAWAAVGCFVLLTISFVVQPGWPSQWMDGVMAAKNMDAPIVHYGGVLILLVLLRWRRPEAWLVLCLAVLPASWGWYGTLPLLTIAASLPQSLFLVATASIGQAIAAKVLSNVDSIPVLYSWTGSAVVITSYLPAVILILLRPNSPPLPAWMETAGSLFARNNRVGVVMQKTNAGV